jgi:hypothetical protein
MCIYTHRDTSLCTYLPDPRRQGRSMIGARHEIPHTMVSHPGSAASPSPAPVGICGRGHQFSNRTLPSPPTRTWRGGFEGASERTKPSAPAGGREGSGSRASSLLRAFRSASIHSAAAAYSCRWKRIRRAAVRAWDAARTRRAPIRSQRMHSATSAPGLCSQSPAGPTHICPRTARAGVPAANETTGPSPSRARARRRRARRRAAGWRRRRR